MDWLWTAALVPILLCGLMCLAGIVIAATGLRRSGGRRRACCGDGTDQDDADQPTHAR